MNFFPFSSKKTSYSQKTFKKGVHGNECLGRMVQPTQLIRISVEAETRALQSYLEFFFEFYFSFRVMHFFFQKNVFLSKKLKF